jgi:hypothetical protein
MATVKKYQKGGVVSTVKKAAAKAVETVKKDNPFKNVADLSKTAGQRFLSKDKVMQKNGGKMKKAKSGGSFPDLNKDGKITKADVLKGRGVIAKSGGKMKKGC